MIGLAPEQQLILKGTVDLSPDVEAMPQSMASMRMLDSEDIARSIVYAIEQPDHVSVSEVLVMPSAQS